MYNLPILILYYFLILVAILGYGLFFSKIFKIKSINNDFGYVGLFGIYVLIIYSYLSNFSGYKHEFSNLLFAKSYNYIISDKDKNQKNLDSLAQVIDIDEWRKMSESSNLV